MEGSTQSLKALGLSLGVASSWHTHTGTWQPVVTFSTLLSLMLILSATMADAAFPSLGVSVPCC